MKKITSVLLLVLSIMFTSVHAQNFTTADDAAAKRIAADIRMLASDSLIGRETGTPGEWMARKYIESEFRKIGIAPLFDTSYFQTFTFKDKAFVDLGTKLEINGHDLLLYNDYYPLGFSANMAASGDIVYAGNGIVCDEPAINDYKNCGDVTGKIVLLDLAIPAALSKNKMIWDSSQKVVRVERAIQRGAKAVIFFSSDTSYGNPMKDPSFYNTFLSVPVVYVQNAKWIDTKAPGNASMKVVINRSGQRKGHNVGGYINNNAPTTVVIGAHYDHLGMGFFDSRDPEVIEVHNGADDNASGVAGVLELARMLKSSEYKNNNYIFLAFSGEEKGLFGSAYFIKSNDAAKAKLNYMIDLDMIGRLDAAKNIKIYGTGTSPSWHTVIAKTERLGLKIKKISTGIGGSDHTPFNQRGVPAIFIHTGLHPDYHKAVDDTEKINFAGEYLVVKYTLNLIQALDDKGKLEFKSAGILDKLLTK